MAYTFSHEMARGGSQVVELGSAALIGNYFDLDTTAEYDFFGNSLRPLEDVIVDLGSDSLPYVDPKLETAGFLELRQIPFLISMARQAAHERATSYRNFHVGAAAYAISTEKLTAAYLFGSNLNPIRGARKRCAEMEILGKADALGLNHIVAMAVFGPSEFADVDSFDSPTLHPCGDCRTLMTHHPAMRPETSIITTNGEGIMELMSRNGLIELHT